MIVTNPFTNLKSWTRDQVETVSKGWWVLLVTGVLSVIAGGIIIFNDWTVSGHFAAWEQPQLFAEGLRAAFCTLR